VAFGTSDFLAEDQIKIVAQNWLVKPLKADISLGEDTPKIASILRFLRV